jgi:hypothetical protein
VTQIKFDSKVIADVEAATASRTGELYRTRGGRWMAVVELAHVEQVTPGPDEEKEPSVKLRITAIELAPTERVDEQLREVAQELYERRTKSGTLMEETGDAVSVSSILHYGAGVLSDA